MSVTLYVPLTRTQSDVPLTLEELCIRRVAMKRYNKLICLVLIIGLIFGGASALYAESPIQGTFSAVKSDNRVAAK
jgi:hypothetical protein